MLVYYVLTNGIRLTASGYEFYLPLLSSLLTILFTLNFLGPLITLSALLLPPDVGIVVGCFSRILRGVRFLFRDEMVDSVNVDE